MFEKIRNASFIVMSVMLLAACSSSGTFTMKQELIEPINSQKTVSIMVKSDKTPESEKEDAQKACSSLQEKLYSRLVSEGIFKSSAIYPNKGDYNLVVDVLGVRLVSNAARLMLGVMAGGSGIEANVLLTDESGKLLTDFHADGNSASHPMSSESGSDNAVNELANQISQVLKKKKI